MSGILGCGPTFEGPLGLLLAFAMLVQEYWPIVLMGCCVPAVLFVASKL